MVDFLLNCTVAKIWNTILHYTAKLCYPGSCLGLSDTAHPTLDQCGILPSRLGGMPHRIPPPVTKPKDYCINPLSTRYLARRPPWNTRQIPWLHSWDSNAVLEMKSSKLQQLQRTNIVRKAKRPNLQKNHVLMVKVGKCLRERIVITENKSIWDYHTYNPLFQTMTTWQYTFSNYENETSDIITRPLQIW